MQVLNAGKVGAVAKRHYAHDLGAAADASTIAKPASAEDAQRQTAAAAAAAAAAPVWAPTTAAAKTAAAAAAQAEPARRWWAFWRRGE